MRCLNACLFFSTLIVICVSARSKDKVNDLTPSILKFTNGFSRYHSFPHVVGRRDIVWSPLSLYEAMLMVHEGAAGDTAKELQRITHLKTKDEHQQWSLTYLTDLEGSKDNRQSNISVKIANRLYADEEFNLDQEFKNNLKKFYHSDLELLDISKPDECAKRVNDWISNQTNQMIKNVLKPADITPMLRLMLVNALHFKGAWAKSFDADLTTKDNFTLSNGKKIEVSMMHQTAHFSYHHDKKHQAQWINLPYKGNNRYVLTLALPDASIELRSLEQKISTTRVLENIFEKLDNRSLVPTRVQLALPKFRIESSLDMISHFKNFYKVKLPFDANNADFSLMSSSRSKDLFISKIIHKAVIDVDEAGTEASAVTVIQMLSRSGMFLHEDPVRLFFTRPFLFYLRDVNMKVPLFVGRFTGIPMP